MLCFADRVRSPEEAKKAGYIVRNSPNGQSYTERFEMLAAGVASDFRAYPGS